MLPETIGNLSSLEELYLVSNRSETFFLPDSIVRLTALKRLDLGQLDVSSFPEGKKNALLALQAKGILDIASLPLNEKRVNVKVMIKQLNERIIKAREGLSQTSWDEDKKNEIMALIQSGEPNILDSPRIREIKYQLVQSGLVFKEINEWRVLDETKHADLALKKGIEIHEKMVNVKDILHPAIKAYFKETIKAKSDAFRKRIPFDYEALE